MSERETSRPKLRTRYSYSIIVCLFSPENRYRQNMTADPRASLATLVTALERHFEVASSRQDPDDPNVIAAAQDLADAFDDYDEALFLATEVATPLAVYDGPFDDEDDTDESDDDDDDDDDDEDLEDEDDDDLEDDDDDIDDIDDIDDDDDDDDAVVDELVDPADRTGVYAGLDDIDFDDEDEPDGPMTTAKATP
jgi:hypothetical protein